ALPAPHTAAGHTPRAHLLDPPLPRRVASRGRPPGWPRRPRPRGPRRWAARADLGSGPPPVRATVAPPVGTAHLAPATPASTSGPSRTPAPASTWAPPRP